MVSCYNAIKITAQRRAIK